MPPEGYGLCSKQCGTDRGLGFSCVKNENHAGPCNPSHAGSFQLEEIQLAQVFHDINRFHGEHVAPKALARIAAHALDRLRDVLYVAGSKDENVRQHVSVKVAAMSAEAEGLVAIMRKYNIS